MTVRILVVGAGVMGLNHLRVLSQSPIADLAGLVEPDQRRALDAAERFKVPTFASLKEAVQKTGAQAVDIVTPTITHHTVGLQALGLGLHTFIEKPLAENSEKAGQLVSEARRTGRILAVGHIERHNPATALLRTLLAKPSEGRILSFVAKRVSPLPPRIQDVGVLTDVGSHEIDIICSLMKSAIVRVFAASDARGTGRPRESNAIVQFEHEDGGLSSIETSWISPIKIRRLETITENHLFVLDYIDQSLRVVRSRFPDLDEHDLYNSMVEYDSREFALRKREPLAAELEDFVESIQQGRAPVVGGEDGLLAVQVMEAALQSAKNGRPVEGKWEPIARPRAG